MVTVTSRPKVGQRTTIHPITKRSRRRDASYSMFTSFHSTLSMVTTNLEFFVSSRLLLLTPSILSDWVRIVNPRGSDCCTGWALGALTESCGVTDYLDGMMKPRCILSILIGPKRKKAETSYGTPVRIRRPFSWEHSTLSRSCTRATSFCSVQGLPELRSEGPKLDSRSIPTW